MPRTIKRQQNLLYEFDYNPEGLIARLKKELNARSISALARDSTLGRNGLAHQPFTRSVNRNGGLVTDTVVLTL